MKRLLLLLSIASCAFCAETKKAFITPRRKKLLTYAGLSSLATYLSLSILNKNAPQAVSQRKLLGYATALPATLGLGLYLGSLYTKFKPDAIASAIASDNDSTRFLSIYASLNMAGTFAYLCAHAKASGEEIKPLPFAVDALGYTGSGCGLVISSYVASLLWAETGLLQAKSSSD